MAFPKVSGGSVERLFFGALQRTRAPITPMLLNALNQNGTAIPTVAIMTPPSAGPTARLTLMPTLFAATAPGRSDFGTSSGTTACQAGAVIAEAAVTMKLKTSNVTGVMKCSQTSAAKAVEVRVTALSPMIKKRRRSTMSTSAPAGIANRNIGRLFATCTSETVSGSVSRLVMSQPEATLYIQPPIFDTTVAPQMTAKVLWRKGAHAEAG